MFTHFEPIKVMPPPLFYAGWTLFSGVMSSCVERWDNHRRLAVGKKKTYSLHLENIVILITKRYDHFPSNSNGNNYLNHIQWDESIQILSQWAVRIFLILKNQRKYFILIGLELYPFTSKVYPFGDFTGMYGSCQFRQS